MSGTETSSDPSWTGINTINRFDVFNGNPQLDPPLCSHTVSGVSGIALDGGAMAPGHDLERDGRQLLLHVHGLRLRHEQPARAGGRPHAVSN